MAIIAVLVGIFITVTVGMFAYRLGQRKLSERTLSMTLDSVPAVKDDLLPKGDSVKVNWLVGVAGEVEGRAFLVGHRTITIGREPMNQIQVSDQEASRKHCQIAPRDGWLQVVDMKSRNGVKINGTPTMSGKLEPGDVLQVGKSRWIYHPKGTFGDDMVTSKKETDKAKFEPTDAASGSSLKYMLKLALDNNNGDVGAAAKELGVDPDQLRKMLEKVGRAKGR